MIFPLSSTSILTISSRDSEDGVIYSFLIIDPATREDNLGLFLYFDELSIFLENISKLQSFPMTNGTELILKQEPSRTNLYVKVDGINWGGLNVFPNELENFLLVIERYKKLLPLQ